MTNNLTGDYDAVVQVRIEAVNRILATLHQNGASKDASPTFLHSFALRISDSAAKSVEEIQSMYEIINWSKIAEAVGVGRQKDSPPSGGGGTKGSQPASKEPPGFSKASEDAQKELQEAMKDLTTPGVVHGIAQVQVSTPMVSFPPGSTSEIIAKMDLRAHYIPDPDTPSLPGPIHGDLEAAFSVKPKVEGNQNVLEVDVTQDDGKITFVPAPGTGLSATDIGKITDRIRAGLRNSIEPTSLPIASDFPFKRFKGLGSGSNQVVALPVTLEGSAPPPSALNSINTQFLSTAGDFGVAISREYIEVLLQPMLGSLKAFHKTLTISIPVPVIFWVVWVDVSYDVSLSSVSLTWQNGSIKLTANGSATTSSILLPNVNFTIEQSLTLVFHSTSQSVTLEAVGDPIVSGIPSMAQAKAKSAIVQARNDAIASAQPAIQGALTGSVTLKDILKDFDNSVNVKYTSLGISPDGVVLHGTVTTKARSDVVVHFNETGDGKGFSALKSWIPGGTIERYEWSWVVGPPDLLQWVGSTKVVTDKHSFVMPKKDDLKTSVCLRVVGTQIPSSAGPVKDVEGGETCTVNFPGFLFKMPKWWETIMTPGWQPDPPPEAVLDDFIVAHVNANAHSQPGAGLGANILVQFAGNPSPTPLETLGRMLSQHKRGDAPIALFLVLPRGSLHERRSDVEKKLESLGTKFADWFAVTEDYDGAWSRTFQVEKTPATYLINARGEFVWQQTGSLDGKAFSAALDEHLISGRFPESRPLRLAVKPGDRAPDLLFPYDGERQMALRKLRGRRVLLNFWKSWSSPCLKELSRLQTLQDESGREETVVLAVNDGEDPKVFAKIRREHNLTLTLVPDPERRIACRYGINCWPTTIAIGADGLVERIKFGKSRDCSSVRT